MRMFPVAAALLISSTLVASAQPTPKSLDPAVETTSSYDDLSCAARYTLAAVVIHNLDAGAAEYYVTRAAEAGDRYLQTHPGETKESYANRVADGAQSLQARISANQLSPQALVAEIKHCDRDSGSRVVT